MFEGSNANTVPLEGWQKTRLILDCLPFIFFIVFTAVFLTVFKTSLKNNPSISIPLVLGAVLLFTGFQAVQRLRDLLSGMALVEDDLLERSWRSSARGSATYHGKFAKMGKLRIMRKAHFQSQNGMHYRVVYSPVSRIVWLLESLG